MRAVVFALAVLLALAPGVGVPAAWALDVSGDDAGERYRGSDGLIMPASTPHDVRVRVATCRGCQWRLTGPCIHSPDEGAQVACMSVVAGCPAGEPRLRVWLSEDDGASWRDQGLMCLGPGGPVTIGAVEQAVREEFERRLPPLVPSAQPPTGLLPYLPVVFDSGQPGSVPTSEHGLLGLPVAISPRPSWHWDFGDGVTLDTALPGSRYPDLSVSHAYRVGGPELVQVTTTWSATFTVDGMGPFPVREPVRQRQALSVRIGQARAVLVP